MEKTNPIFIKIDEYKDVLDIVSLIKKRISEGRTVLSKINDLKNQEDEELQNWSVELDDIEKKIDFINSNLFEPEE